MVEELGVWHEFPLWVVILAFVLILTGTLELGFRLGSGSSPNRKKSGQIVTLQAAILGLLALVLSFTYSFVSSRLEDRKNAVISEANAIGTAYLRAEFAPEPLRGQLRSILRSYARTRVVTSETAETRESLSRQIAHSLSIQKQLWPAMMNIMEQSQAGPKETLLAQAVNEVIDVHTVRIRVGFDSLPGIVFAMMLFIAGLGMFITGYAAEEASRWPSMAFAVLLAFIMYIIVDMDKSNTGFVRVSQQPLEQVIVSTPAKEPSARPPAPIE
jgi:hypothetical protein